MCCEALPATILDPCAPRGPLIPIPKSCRPAVRGDQPTRSAAVPRGCGAGNGPLDERGRSSALPSGSGT